MAQPTFAAIDIGSTKICTVVAELGPSNEIRILGVGVGPSQGITRGMVDNIHAAMEAISSSVQRAERAAGVRILSAHVGFTGPHISSMGSRGIVAITDPRLPIAESDMDRALESARIVNIPNNREVVHVVPRYYVVDGQDHVANALGMFGSRLDMETHVVTAGSSAIQNILRCVEGAGVHVDSLIVGPLAAAEAAAEREELQHGAVLIDIGGGATDITVFVRGTPVHTAVLPVGGAQMTGDLVVALRVPQPAAEQAKNRPRPRARLARRRVRDDRDRRLRRRGPQGDPEALRGRGAAGALRGTAGDGARRGAARRADRAARRGRGADRRRLLDPRPRSACRGGARTAGPHRPAAPPGGALRSAERPRLLRCRWDCSAGRCASRKSCCAPPRAAVAASAACSGKSRS